MKAESNKDFWDAYSNYWNDVKSALTTSASHLAAFEAASELNDLTEPLIF